MDANTERESNTNLFFSNFSGISGISRQNPGISREKVWFPWVSKDLPNFLAPTPSRGRPPRDPKISGPKGLGLGSFFFPEQREISLCISIQKLQIGGRQSLFGGCRFTFWRVLIYILEAEIVLGVIYRKGVIPKKGGTLFGRHEQ